MTETKTCSKCKIEKPFSEYPKDKSTRLGITPSCKACRYAHTNKANRETYAKEKKRILDKNKKWRQKNWKSVYAQRVASGSQQRGRKNWYHNKGKFNIQYVITERLRKRIRSTVSQGYKSESTMILLGCGIEEFLEYLQSKFTKGMNWENYGEWHIDHIRPCSSFDLTKREDQLLCFNYKNLQPLWAKDNLSKGNKY